MILSVSSCFVALVYSLTLAQCQLTKCGDWDLVNTLNNSNCCINEDNATVNCIPNLIIAGTQKCGTTALAGLLAQFPFVLLSKDKEVHYFDKNITSHKLTYANNFKMTIEKWHNLSDIKGSINYPITVDATPFYIASRYACSRISTFYNLNKNTSSSSSPVKLIVLTRDPMERLYSEYQMKVR